MQPTRVSPLRARSIALATIVTVLAACSGGDSDEGDLSGLAGEATSTTAVGGVTPSSIAPAGGGLSVPGSSTTAGAPGAGAPSSAGAPATTSPPRSGVAPGGAVKLGVGVTDSTITLGFLESSDVGAANQAVGGSSARAGETPRKDYGDPLIKSLNERGGIAGRKIVPVWADVKVTPNNTMAANRQSVCATWTQDNKVFAAQVTSSLMYQDVFECLRKAGSLMILSQESQYGADSEVLNRWPNIYLPFTFALDREMRLFADKIAESGFVDTKLAKVGVAYYRTDAAARVVSNVLKPRLASRGITVAEEASFTPTESVDTFAQTQAEAQSAVLRFRAAGVTHVIFAMANGGFLSGPFLSNAEQQSYRPRYMFNTSTSPGAMPGSKPNAQLNRAMLLSWGAIDQGWEQGLAKTARMQQCLAMLKDEGHPPPRDGLMGGAFAQFCDYVFLMKDALEGNRDFTHTGFASALARLTPRETVFTYRSHPSGRRDGAAAYRMATYDPGCGCFPLTSPLSPAL